MCIFFYILQFTWYYDDIRFQEFRVSILEIMLYLIIGCVVGHVWCSSLLLAAVIEHGPESPW